MGILGGFGGFWGGPGGLPGPRGGQRSRGSYLSDYFLVTKPQEKNQINKILGQILGQFRGFYLYLFCTLVMADLRSQIL